MNGRVVHMQSRGRGISTTEWRDVVFRRVQKIWGERVWWNDDDLVLLHNDEDDAPAVVRVERVSGRDTVLVSSGCAVTAFTVEGLAIFGVNGMVVFRQGNTVLSVED